jgi:ADP-ribosylglycohydrolase
MTGPAALRASLAASRFDVGRRYGAGALELLERIRDGDHWRTASVESFGGGFCVAAGGDMDTTAAITGGIVAARSGSEGIPVHWMASRQALPGWLE